METQKTQKHKVKRKGEEQEERNKEKAVLLFGKQDVIMPFV